MTKGLHRGSLRKKSDITPTDIIARIVLCIELEGDGGCSSFTSEQKAEMIRFVKSFMEKNTDKAVNEDLEFYAQRVEDYYDVGEERGYLCTHRGDIKNAVIVGAKWQMGKDLSSINKSYESGVVFGMNAQREQMMKEAVEGKIYGDIKDQEDEPYEIWAESYSLPKDKFHLHENVKLVIVKED